MKFSIGALIGAIALTAVLSFFIGKNSTQTATTTTEQTTAKESKKSKAETKTIPPKDIDDTSTSQATATKEEATEVEELEGKEVPEVITETPTAAGDAVLARMIKGVSDDKLSSELENIAAELEAQKLAYISDQGQDCSGIFHKIKDIIQKRIPSLGKKETYKYPAYASIRSSRQIADWYHKNGNLLVVENPMASRNSIRPGSVMFFAKPGKKFKNMTIEQLTDSKNNFTSNGYIMHIAVVTAVETDENGDVIAYTMMHGRNKRIHASRSGSKEIQSNNTKGLPAFGNWSQQWVAVANIATPV